MKDFLKMFFASVLSTVFLLMFIVFLLVAVSPGDKPASVQDSSYLIIDLYGQILPYAPPGDIVAKILESEPRTLNGILDNLDKAAVDERIAGVIMKVSANNSLGGASLGEIRDAIAKVQQAGKKVYAFSDDLNRSALFLASACDSIFMPPTGDVTIVGMGGSVMYFHDLLQKLDIHPNLHRIAEYKSAAEPFLRKDMSPETREMYSWLMDDLWDNEIQHISEDRGIPVERLTELMEFALFTAQQAKDAGLIDELRYWDEVDSLLRGPDDDELRTVSEFEYADVERSSLIKGKKTIAVVHAFGLIGGRESRIDPMFGVVMGHESVVRDLRQAGEDEDIDGVVFRVDSNGGESLASDLIGHQVEILAREKPVVASMIDVAASGGYCIAYRATKVLADPMTITGSIGSITGKLNVAGMYGKIGITFDRISKGPNGFLWSEFDDFTEKQKERMADNHWNSFNIWLEDIAETRGIPMDSLRSLAMGRVWTGRQAVENRLVDEVGGLDRAIEVAKELAGIPADEDVTIVHYPREKGLVEMIMGENIGETALRWSLYRFIHHDLAESLRLLGAVSQPHVR
jgi:protease-4